MDQAPGGGTPGTVDAGTRPPEQAAPVDLQHELAVLGLEDIVELASGGFATVYRGHQPTMGRNVAVKILTAPVSDGLVRSRFQRECQALGLLSDHPAIVTVFDAGFLPSGRPYLAMELMTGGSLSEHIDVHGPMPWNDVLAAGVLIAGALHSAHHHGVLHRDVKPANILMSEYGTPKLGDFGIARLQGAEHTRTGALTGSLAHAAPELLGGAAPSVRSDVYALGSTLFTLLRGEPAFLHGTDESIIPALTRITAAAIPDLRSEGVPAGVCDVVERLMAKRPGDRPLSSATAGRALQQAQAALGCPVSVLVIPDGDPAPVTAPATPPATPAADAPHARPWRARAAAVVVIAAVAAVGLVMAGRTPHPPATDAVADTAATPLDVAPIVAQLSQLRGLPPDARVPAALLPSAVYDKAIREWSTAGRNKELQAQQRVFEALHLIPAGTDLVALTQDLYAEQFLAFHDADRIAVRADSAELSALQRSLVADETASALLDARYDITTRASGLADTDARRAWTSLAAGDAAVTAAAWTERFLPDAEQQLRAAELSAQPDRIARGLPEALRAELVFPYVAGEAFVRSLFDGGGVAAIEQAYANPPQTTEQLLHPAKYRRREAAVPVDVPAAAPPGWSPLHSQTIGEFDVRQLTAVLGSSRSTTAAQGWGGGQLRAWQQEHETAVRVDLVFDTPRDARQACSALREAHQARSAAVPVAPDVLVTPGDAFVLRCSGVVVDFAVAPDRAAARSLLGP